MFSVAIYEINGRSTQEYEGLLGQINRDSPSRFFRYLPSFRKDWLLVFDLDGRSVPEARHESFAIRSASVGPRYYLRWKDVEPKPKQAFLGFCDRLAIVLQDPGRRVERARDPSLTQTKAVLQAYVHDDGRVTRVPACKSTFAEIHMGCVLNDFPRYAAVQVDDELWVIDMWQARLENGWSPQMGPSTGLSGPRVRLGGVGAALKGGGAKISDRLLT